MRKCSLKKDNAGDVIALKLSNSEYIPKRENKMPLIIRQFIEKTELTFYLIYSIGIAGYAFRSLRPVMNRLTLPVLFFTAVYAFVRTYFDSGKEKRKLLVLWSSGVFVVTMILEILGVQHGLFFGEYNYGDVLGPRVLGVPLIIGINWLIVIIGATSFVRKYSGNIIILAVLTGLTAFLFDYLMEPGAIALGFWEWSGPVPIKNYITWFTISCVSSLIAMSLKLDISRKWAQALLGAQIIFFLFIRLFIYIKLL